VSPLANRRTTVEDGEARPATFDSLYPAELRERVLAAEWR
jgi:hypothetical protein